MIPTLIAGLIGLIIVTRSRPRPEQVPVRVRVEEPRRVRRQR